MGVFFKNFVRNAVAQVTLTGNERFPLVDEDGSEVTEYVEYDTIKADLDGRYAPYGFTPGRYYGTPGSLSTGGFTLATAALTASRLSVAPFPVSTTSSFDRIGMRVATAAAGSVVRLGIYGSDANGFPAARVLDAGTVDSSTTGTKEIVIAQSLEPGLYWVGGAAQGGSPTVAVTTGNGEGIGDNTLSGATTFLRAGLGNTAVAGALPASFGWNANEVTVPRVVLRAA